MTSCQFTIQIKDYEPKNFPTIPYDNFQFHIRPSSSLEQILILSDFKTSQITTKINQINHDIKFTVRIQILKNSNLIGICDFSIPFNSIQKTKPGDSFTIEKKCQVILLESTKSLFFPGIQSSSCEMHFVFEVNTKVLSISPKRIFKSNSMNKRCKKEDMNVQNKTALSFGYMPLSPKIEKNKLRNKYNIDIEIYKEFKMIKTPPSGEIRNKKGFILDDSVTNTNRNLNNNSSNYFYGSTSFRSSKFSSGRKSKNSKTFKQNNNKHNYTSNSNYRRSVPLPTKSYNSKLNKTYQSNESLLLPQFYDDNKQIEININDCSLFLNEKYSEDKNKLNVLNSQLKSQYNNIKQKLTTQTPINNINIHYNHTNVSNLKLKLANHLKELFLYNKYQQAKIIYYTKNNNKLKQILINSQNKYVREQQYKTNLSNQYNTLKTNVYNIKFLYSALPQITKNELKIYQHIFNKFYFESNILQYKENEFLNTIDNNIKLNLLLKCVKGMISSYGNVTGLVQIIPLAIRAKVKSFLGRYNIQEKEIVGKGEIYDNKIKAITEEDENEEEEEMLKKVIEKINLNRKVKFRYVGGNVYTYGVKKVRVMLDGNGELKIKDGKGYIGVEKFIEMNEKGEEKKMGNARSKSHSGVISTTYHKEKGEVSEENDNVNKGKLNNNSVDKKKRKKR